MAKYKSLMEYWEEELYMLQPHQLYAYLSANELHKLNIEFKKDIVNVYIYDLLLQDVDTLLKLMEDLETFDMYDIRLLRLYKQGYINYKDEFGATYIILSSKVLGFVNVGKEFIKNFINIKNENE